MAVEAVMRVLRAHLTPGALEDIFAVMPADVEALLAG
jgi:uncharacterized protein (DUF2267 family)